MPNMKLDLPPGFLLVNTDKITPNVMEKLAETLSAVRLKHSPFAKYPMLDDETIEQWQERVSPQLTEDNQKKDGESANDFLKRIYKVDMTRKAVLFDTLVALGDTFGQSGKVTMETFGGGSYPQMKAFVRDVLKACDFDTRDFD